MGDGRWVVEWLSGDVHTSRRPAASTAFDTRAPREPEACRGSTRPSRARQAFPKLRVKLKKLVPALPGDTDLDLNDRGIDLAPEAWAKMMADASDNKLVLDVSHL